MESIQNVVQNAQKIVDNIGKQPHRSSSKELQRSQGRPDYDLRPTNTYLRTGYTNGQPATASLKGYQSDNTVEQSLVSAGVPPHDHTSVDTMTNLERYKQKLKTQRVSDPQHAPSLAYKASVRDTVSKL